jgi:oligopeptide/dipeptide ABC transporter ATP-binding protein
LIADEPTTALDVTLQAQILRLLREMQRETGTTVVLISHDIGVIGAMSEQVAVFYAGRVVESGSAERVLRRPMHPYTIGLLDSMPDHALNRLKVIPGRPPMPGEIGEGCAFAPRCGHRINICGQDPPAHRLPDGVCACRLAAPSELNA